MGRKLHKIYRIETSIGRIVIAYSERRRITSGRSTRDIDVRKAIRRLREGGRRKLSIKQPGLSRRSLGDMVQF